LSNYAAIRQQTTGLRRHQQSIKAIKDVDLLSRMAVDVLDEARTAGESHFVVFAEQLELVDSLVRELEERTYPTWTITGREKPELRAKSLLKHQDSNFGVLVGTKAIEAGLNLQYCSLLVSVDASWSYRREAQREGRICRTGSPFERVRHVRLLRNVDLEERRRKRVETKQGLHEEVMNAVPRSDTVRLTRPA
jgi:superfamily II DNA or RNA helicase